jgi:RND family efflux transporter MFP subunit
MTTYHMTKLPSSRLMSASLLTLVAIFALSGCKNKAEEAPDVAVAVQSQHPSLGPISEEITSDAILAPLAEAAISPRISSPIRAEYVQRGTHVRRGQVLLTLEARDLEGAALDSKGNLTSSEASFTATTQATIPEDVQKATLDVAQTKANMDVALQTAADRKRLFAQGALPGRDADLAAAASVQAQAAYDTANKHLTSVLSTIQQTDAKVAEGQLTSAKGRFINAEAQVSYATLRSPINGVVTDRPLFPGETAVAGTPVVTVMDTSSLVAKLHITQANAQQLNLGGKAEVTVPGVEDPVEATVSLISPALDPGSTTVEVWLKLANPDGRFKVGTAVHAVIRGMTVPNALQIPISALLPAPDGSTNVMVVGADDVAHLRSVKVGIRTAQKVQITDGLSLKDNVITNGSYGLDDGTKVTSGGAKPDTGDKD